MQQLLIQFHCKLWQIFNKGFVTNKEETIILVFFEVFH
jgi:hypothetical protein